MKCVYVSLVSLLLVSIKADETNTTESLVDLHSEENNPKSSEKRWTQDNPSSHAQHNYLPGPTSSVGQGLVGRMIERAKEEKTLRDFIPMKDDFHGIFISALRPKPIVDTASEEEKSAPNHGSGTEFLGDLIVRGSETFSRAILSVLDVPKRAFGKLSASTTQALNQIGAYLVGL